MASLEQAIQQINLLQLRAFEAVFRTRSMTLAAQELHLTQPGISQHIQALEAILEQKLFDRVHRKLIPTQEGETFNNHCAKMLSELKTALTDLRQEKQALTGDVSIGMPIEFGNNLVIPLLSKIGALHPGIQFKIKLDFASEMNEGLLKGELDFAFVDEYRMDRQILLEPVAHEILELCASRTLLKKFGKPQHHLDYFEKLPYVDYQKDAPILRSWFKHHFGSRAPFLNIRATVMDVQGVSKLIFGGLGAGVIPAYLVSKLEAEGQNLVRFQVATQPLKNRISAASLRGRTLSAPARFALDFIKSELREVDLT